MPDIKPAKPSDLNAILSMIRALSAFHGDRAQVTKALLHDIFFGAAPTANAFVAYDDSTTIGYMALTPLMVIHDGKIRLDIHHLFVTEAYRGRGVGTALIEAAKTYAIKSGATRLTIGTAPDNATAIAAYRSMPLLDPLTDGPRFRVNLSS